MSQDALPLDEAFEAISRMDAVALMALCDPEVSFESRITAIEDATYRGHEGVRHYIANLIEAFEDIDVQHSDRVGHGDRAVATNHFRARGRVGGVEVEQRFFVAAKGRKGRLVWWGFFDSSPDALEAVGLSE
jgi:ketosteroid isomerase-like protein